MTAVDFVVIGLYALGMLAVGAYYGRRSRTADDYLLGGRNMNFWLIGVSLFATLLSTLSYLALPGEMIKNGPMVFSEFAAQPVALLIVGFVLIPRIMAQPVTSGYELLETRLGTSGRLLGSGMFVALRIIWMAAILYATTDKVLLPILGLQPAWAPLLCAALGVITLIYTAEGGLRAVVLTDALQAVLMFLGALGTIFLITWRLGGIEAWWPSARPPHWQEFVFWPREGMRISFVGAVLNMLVWSVCTAGSDQMAIQRYLATRDARTARRSYAVNVLSVILSGTLLGLVGVAVLGYFQARPEELPAGITVSGDADQLLPHFIVIGLPPGMTGLVIAAILSAAMSSLSSGMNSSCAVIVTDFIDRWRGRGARKGSDAEPPGHQVTTAPSVTGIALAPGGGEEDAGQARQVRTARTVAVAVGVVAVLLSTAVGGLAGNLLELCFKVVNLLTAPLFVLFFLALFVRWSTPFGAIVATVASVAAAITVSFGEVFGRSSLLWIAPTGLAVGVAVGMLASLVPVRVEPWEGGQAPRD